MLHEVLRFWVHVALLVGVVAITASSAVMADEPVIQITAKKFEYSLRTLTLKKGVPVVLELTALDRVHGFNLPDFGVRTDVVPGKVTRIRFTPDKTGEFVFFCDVFCGEGHEEMSGVLTVTD
ncbi:MAG: cytochrome-c oxidase [Proteobacteria bacterium]|nr:cytochrome-c oxidase [Pseudomonadota bacterium]MBS1246206.1 cytochrome-c oxidase [Pseudomonadota bacterium]